MNGVSEGRRRSVARSFAKILHKEPTNTCAAIVDYPDAHFLSLPGEIRNHIYSHLFHPVEIEVYLGEVTSNPYFHNGLSALRVCRQIYSEAQGMAYSGFTPTLTKFGQPYIFATPPPRKTAKLISRSQHRSLSAYVADSIRRITVQQHLFYGIYVWSQVPKSGIAAREVILQICLCKDLAMLHATPGKLTHVLDTCASAAHGIPSLKQVHIYYCGRPLGTQQVNLADMVEEHVLPKAGRTMRRRGPDGACSTSSGRDIPAEPFSLTRHSTLSATITDQNRTFISEKADVFELEDRSQQFHQEDRLANTTVHFWNSVSVCGRGCIRQSTSFDASSDSNLVKTTRSFSSWSLNSQRSTNANV